jgi:hypothetical protein
VRTHLKGDSMYTEQFDSTVSKVMYYDYRLEGHSQIICATTEGDVKGFSVTANKKDIQLKDDTDLVEQTKLV